MVEELLSHKNEIEALCKKHRVKRLDVFGSAARGDFDAQRSDFDFLVIFEPGERKGFGDVYFQLLLDLEALLGREVHLVEEECQDADFMRFANRSRELLYAA